MTLAAEINSSSPEKLLSPVLSAFWDQPDSWTLETYGVTALTGLVLAVLPWSGGHG